MTYATNNKNLKLHWDKLLVFIVSVELYSSELTPWVTNQGGQNDMRRVHAYTSTPVQGILLLTHRHPPAPNLPPLFQSEAFILPTPTPVHFVYN